LFIFVVCNIDPRIAKIRFKTAESKQKYEEKYPRKIRDPIEFRRPKNQE